MSILAYKWDIRYIEDKSTAWRILMGMYNNADTGPKDLTWTGFLVVWGGGFFSLIALLAVFVWLVYTWTSGALG